MSDGSPFSGENTPVGAPEPKMSQPPDNNGAWGERVGGYQGEEMKLGGGGGGARRENACVIFEIPPL
jgi:hypothetical protein